MLIPRAGVAPRGLGLGRRSSRRRLALAPSVQLRRPQKLVTRRTARVWFFNKRFLSEGRSYIPPSPEIRTPLV